MDCKSGLSFEKCEEAVLSQAVEQIEVDHGEVLMQSAETKKMLRLATGFLRKHGCIMYGGTAVNNILPPKNQFYDYSFQLPDYDAFHPDALRMIEEIYNLFIKNGFTNVEAKSGIHYNTFKLFINNIPLIDLTNIAPELFERLKRDAIVKDGLKYAPPDFLRMSMYLELSRPDGDISRWSKVYRRLGMLNKVFPMKATACGAPDKFDLHIYETIYKTLIKDDALFIGGYAFKFYAKKVNLSEFDVVSADPKRTCSALLKALPGASLRTHAPVGTLIGTHYSIYMDGKHLLIVFPTMACHNYNLVKDVHGNKVKVGTVDTLFSFYLVFLYADRDYIDPARIMCSCSTLFRSRDRSQRRFTATCYGKQETLADIRDHKNKLRKTLKRGSDEWNRNFFVLINGAK